MGRPTIDGIFVDFGNVCARFDFKRFFDSFSKHTGKDPVAVEHTLCGGVADGKNYSKLFMAFECGEITPTNFFRTLANYLDCAHAIDYETFARFWISIFIEENTALNELLHEVRSKKFLLSNINAISHDQYVDHCKIVQKHFRTEEQRFLSYRIGALKPHPQIYETAFRRTGIAPSRTLFIDDVEANISAWRALGGHGIVYNAHENGIQELARQLQEYAII